MQTKPTIQQQTESQEALRKIIQPGAKIYFLSRKVTKSGVQHHIQAFLPVIDEHGRPSIIDISGSVSRANGWVYDSSNDHILVAGGMDVAFRTIYKLGKVLFPGGFTVPPTGAGNSRQPGEFESDSGYALIHGWL